MSTSFQEAVEAVAKRRQCSEDEAALIVAEEYGQVASLEEWADDGSEFDEVDEADVWLRDHRNLDAGLNPLPLDEERSPMGLIHATAERMEAKREGDRYRDMSRRYST